MNSFGLGLILNFTDNATAGMRGATQAFQLMSSTADACCSSVGSAVDNMVFACYALDTVGATLVNIGSSVVGTYLDVSQAVIDTGMTMMGFRMQLRALYGENAFEDKMKQIQIYAKDSVFEVQGLMKAVVTMKAVGIEAMDAVTSSSGKTTQTLMDYASDIAAMFPNMRNVYGTGVNAAMGALKEYIAEGNALSLKRGAGLDITGLLGEDKGATIEERTQQVADLVEQLGIAGYTVSLMGTPTQQLSKMQDILFNTMSSIADSGVFERYTQLLTTLADWLNNLAEDTDRYNAVVALLGDTVVSVLTPLENILGRLLTRADALVDWAIANPDLARNILLTVGALGAFLVVGGLFLRFVSALGMASAGFNFLRSLPTLLRAVGAGFGNLILRAIPFVALAGLAYYAWEQNLFGIRDVITEAIQDIRDIFTVLGDAWGDFTLSEENYNLAESLGILPLVESLLQLQYYWSYFSEGFVEGFNGFFKSIENTLGTFGIDVSDIFARIGEFLKSLIAFGQEDQWTKIGEVAGKIAGIAVSVLALVRVFSFLRPLFSLFGRGSGGGGLGGSSSGGVLARTTFKDLAKIGTILLGLVGILTILALVSKIPFSIPRVLQLTVVIGLLGVIGVAVTKLSSKVGSIPVGTVAKGLANIAIIVGGLSALLAIIGLVSMIPFDTARVLQVVAIIGIIGVLGAALSAVSALIGLIPVALVALGLANIAIVMGGLTGLFAIMALASSLASPGDVLGVVAIVTVLGVLGSVLSVLAGIIGLIPFPVVLTGIASISAVLAALTGLAVLISEALPTIGENISQFTTALEPAFESFQMLQGLNMAGIGSFFDSFGSFMLKVTGDKFASFFTGGNGLTKAAEGLVDFATVSQEAFNIFAQINTGSIDSLMGAIDSIEAVGSKNIPSTYEGMYTTIETCVNNSMTLLNNFASQGSSIGGALMNSIASGIAAQAGVVRDALSSALSGINVTASPKVSLNLSPTVNTTGMIGLATGGYVKETGVAVLHPDEVVVNDDTTRRLNEFLNAQQSGSTSSNSSFNTSKGETHNDYSVTFSAGSVVIQLSNASDSELEKAADKLMKIIERKQQLKAMASRA